MENNMKKKIPADIKKLMLWKLEADLSPHHKLSINNNKSFTKTELKKHIEDEDSVGIMFVEMQLKFMQAVVKG
jgi:hypothetical protein